MKHRSMRLLAPFLRRYWRALAAAATASLVTAAAEVARPFPIAIAIDKVLGSHGDTGFALTTEDVHLIVIAAGLVIVIALCDAAASYQVDVRLERAGERIVHDLRVAIYEHLQRLSLTFHDRRPTGDLVTRLTGDVNAVGGMFSESLGTIATSALLLVGMAAVTIAIDPVLALAAFSVTPVLAAVTVRFRRRLKSVSRRQRATEGEIASLASEALSAMRVVKAMSSEGYEKERMTRRSESVRRDGIEAARIEGRFTGIIDVTGAFATAIVLTLGVYRAASGHISIGELVIVNSYVRRIYRPLRDIARQASRVSRAMARGDRIAEILASDEVLREVASPYQGGRARGDVELSGVTFAYPGGPPVLTDVSLRFRAGQRVALVGPSGAGKSTLFSLVTRFYDPDTGTVRIDGRDASACSLEWLRDQVGLVLQDTVLFSGTVAENIVYGLSMTTHIDSVVAAATAAGAHEFISALPSGYDTDLGARGVCLSGGQRQRIAIARALLRNPPILLLDEPTAGLDAESEAEVLDGLAVLMQGRTVMMSTHSLALTRSADRVVVLERGRVTQSGSSKDLLGEQGVFRRLATLQGLVTDGAVDVATDTDAYARPPAVSPAAHHGVRARGDVEFAGVTFAYPGRVGPPAVVDVSLWLEAGRRVALVGPPGAGKTTLASLLARAYDPQAGRVLVDGRDASARPLQWLRDQLAIVTRDTAFTSGTVAENLAYGLTATVGSDALVAAATAVGAHGFISSLPSGYDTDLGARGVSLTDAQHQLMAVVRALLRDAPIVILDDPTGGLDPGSDGPVLAALDVLMEGRSVLMITRCEALLHSADRVLTMEGGRVIDGTQPPPADQPEAAPSEAAQSEATPPPEERGDARRRPTAFASVLPDDPALPRLPTLVDAEAMSAVFQRTLGREQADGPPPDVTVHCLRYKPGTNLVVHYLVGLNGDVHHATAMIAGDRNLAKRAASVPNRKLARMVDGRSPAASPLSYDAGIGALIQWLPLDLQLPALALRPSDLRHRLAAHGVATDGDDPTMLAYRPRRRAVEGLGSHVVKIYAAQLDFDRAVQGLTSAAGIAGVPTPALEAVLPDLRLTVQMRLPEATSGSAVDVATEAGRLLAAFHASPVDGLEALPPPDQLQRAARSASLVIAVSPSLEPRVRRLLADLEELQPDDPPLVRAHGDFHAGQVVETRGILALVDLDEACRAPAALDVANYAAHLVRGADVDLGAAQDCLQLLLDGYGARPEHLSWYMATAVLRRAPFPFRFLDERWPEAMTSQIEAAEAALRW